MTQSCTNLAAKLFFAFLFLCGTTNAQSWQWLTGAGSTSGGEIARAACTDATGNAYFCGNFTNTVNIGGFPLTSSGSNDVFVAKYNSAGTCLWAVKAGGPVSDVANGITTDGSSVYITGTFAPASSTFGAFTINTNGAASDGFIAKLDCSTGAFTWAVNFSNSTGGGDVGHAACIDGSGNPYICGNFAATVNFGSASYTASGATDFFVARVNPSTGALVWGAVGGGTGGDNGIGSGLCYVPGLNEIVAASSFNTSSTYYTTSPASGPFNFTNSGGNDIVLLEINATTGAIQSALQHSGANNEDCMGVCYDPATTNVMLAGYFASPTVTFGSTTLTNAGAAGSEDIFITSYNPSTNTFPWAQRAGGTLNERAWGVSSAGNGVISVTGQFRSSPTTFGSTSLNAAGFADVFVTALVPGTGAYIWAISASGNDAGLDDVGRAVAYTTDGSGNVYVCGQYASTLTAGAFNITSNGSVDFFFAKLLAPPPLTATQSQVNLTCNGVCSGSATVVASGGVAPYTYSWSPSGGSGATASSLCAQTYTCTITDNVGTSITRTFNITQPPAITITPISQTNVSCNGGATGAAQVSSAGGTGALTYNWTPGNPTGDGTGSVTGLTAQVYTVTVTDANSCNATRTFNITQPPALVVNPVSQTNVACFGGATGAASVSVTGGVPSYTYNWTPGNPTGDGTASVTGLTAGTWTCTVTDANSCVGTRTFNITSPTAISVTAASQTNVSCNGGSNGAASINTPTGGAGGYTYNWTPGNPTGDGTVSVTGLTAGTWTCTVTDANSCVATSTFNVTAPTAISVTPASQTNVSCNGGSNGAASINTPTGGAGGYTYNWTPGNPTGDGTTSVTGLTAGTWTCTVTDASLCMATATFNITQPTPISVTPASQTNVSVFGGNDGAASINIPTGGAGSYTYNWTPGNPTGDGTTSVTGLTAGIWTCTVTDANGCTVTQTFNITQPAAPAAALNFDGTNDNVSVPNSASLNISSAITLESWVYATKNTGTQNGMCKSNCTTSNTGYIFPRTDDGWATCVMYLHIGGVWRTLSAPYPGLNQWVHLAATYDGTNMRLYINGVLAATSPAYTGGIFLNTNPLTIGTQPGCPEYFGGSLDECRIWNRALCQSEIQNNMSCEIPTNSTGLVANYHFNQGSASANNAAVTTLTDATSNANNGTLTGFTLNGGTSNWVAPGGVVTGTSCTAFSSSVTISSSSQTNVSCFGGSNGAASVTASGGSGLSYNWTPGNPSGDGTASVTGLTAGTWTVTVSNDCGGSNTQTFNITQPGSSVSGSSIITNVACFGGSNGAINLTSSGGTGPYTYQWLPSGPTTEDRTGLTAGTYTVQITDANGCTGNVTATVTQPAAISVTMTQSNVSCNGGNNGSASVSVSGGTPGYTYAWTPAGGTSATATGLSAGCYTITVTDANACITVSLVCITQPTALSVSSTITNVSCNGGNNGSATVSVMGGIVPYTYSWAPGGGTSATASGLTQGTYTCTVTDNNGCTIAHSVAITEPAALSSTDTWTNITCFGAFDGTAQVSVSGGTSPYTYSWSPSGGTGPSASNLAAGIYACNITDANGCTLTPTFIISEPSMLSAITMQTNVSCNGGNNGDAMVMVSGGTPGYTYAWSPSGGTAATESNLTAGSYTCVTTDANNCTISNTFSITEPPALIATTVQTNALCDGGTNGSIDLTVSGGTGPYSYDWNSGTYSTQDISGLSAGAYTVVVTDDNSCTTSGTVTITEPAAIVITSTTSSPSCYGYCDGSATVTVTGGTPAYVYSWVPTGPNNLCAGTYTVVITDANGCTEFSSVLVTQPAPIVVTYIEPTDTACQTTTSPFTLSGESPAGGMFSGPGVSAGTFDPLSANIGYNVIIYSYTDSLGCSGSASDSIWVDLCMNVSSIANNQFTLFPNPTSGYVTVVTENPDAIIQVFDATGKMVLNETTNSTQTELDLSSLTEGIYFVVVQQNDQRSTQKIIISK